MRLKYKIVSACVLIMCFVSCKNAYKNSEPGETDIVAVQTFPEDFDGFFTRFQQDSAFQMEHIVFPLEGKHTSYDSEEMLYWDKESWKLHGEYDESLTDFRRTYQVFNGIVIEIIQDKYDFSKIERRFAKMNNEWMLIYYGITSADQ